MKTSRNQNPPPTPSPWPVPTNVASCGGGANDLMNSDFPVIEVDQQSPRKRKQNATKIIETFGQMEKSIDTVLTAMGFCGS